MAKTNQEMAAEFKSYIPFIEGLQALDETLWDRPIEEGKWSLKALVAHLLKWDQYFYEEAIAKIRRQEPLTVRHLNFDEFNYNARIYSETQTKEELIAQFIDWRSKIVEAIGGLDDSEFEKEYVDGDRKKVQHSQLCALLYLS